MLTEEDHSESTYDRIIATGPHCLQITAPWSHESTLIKKLHTSEKNTFRLLYEYNNSTLSPFHGMPAGLQGTCAFQLCLIHSTKASQPTWPDQCVKSPTIKCLSCLHAGIYGRMGEEAMYTMMQLWGLYKCTLQTYLTQVMGPSSWYAASKCPISVTIKAQLFLCPLVFWTYKLTLNVNSVNKGSFRDLCKYNELCDYQMGLEPVCINIMGGTSVGECMLVRTAGSQDLKCMARVWCRALHGGHKTGHFPPRTHTLVGAPMYTICKECNYWPASPSTLSPCHILQPRRAAIVLCAYNQ